MLYATWTAALFSAMLLSGCSGHRSLNDDELKSAATEIISIASEGELFATVAAEDHAPAKYVKSHPEYLRKEATDIAKELAQGQPELDAKPRFDQLRHAVKHLVDTLDALPASPGDPHWQQSQSELNDIRSEAERIRQTF